MRILFIGFGSVAKEMARIFIESEKYPALTLAPQVVGIFTSRHGGIENKNGIDLASVLNSLRTTGKLSAKPEELSALSPLGAAQTLDYDVLVELSSLNIKEAGEPAASHIRAALSRGKDVVSANKGPVAFHWKELTELAKKKGATYLFESAVLDGAPVFNLASRCMKGATVSGFSGVLNGTTNFILSHMEKGGTFEEGLKQAQAEGIAEADPTMDTDGWDPAAKTAALANVLMGAEITPLEVKRTGISQITPQMAQEALSRGRRIKLLCAAHRVNEKIEATVAPQEVAKDDIMALVSHFGAALRIESDLLHPTVIMQECPDLTDTAFGVIEDLITIETKKQND